MPRTRLVYWDPRATRGGSRLGRLVSLAPRKQNFGDLLGPRVTEALAGTAGWRPWPVPRRLPVSADRRRRLLTVGSIVHFARDGDVVWGSGVNGKIAESAYRFADVDVRAVRGPLTQEWFARRGVDAPSVHGDPALLLPTLEPGLVGLTAHKRRSLAVVPNLNEVDRWSTHPDLVDPRDPVDAVLAAIATSERVVTSSLHGLVVAESLGVPVSLVQSTVEPDLKFRDYVLGTGRDGIERHEDLDRALRAKPAPASLPWDPAPLLEAFPWDVLHRAEGAGPWFDRGAPARTDDAATTLPVEPSSADVGPRS